jgi:hypothetical protein
MTDLIEDIQRAYNRPKGKSKATNNEGADAIDQVISKGSEKRRRVKRGESKMKSFSMGGMADYIKDLL